MNYISEYYDAETKPSTSLSVYQCGWQDCGPGHSYGPAIRDHYVIHYIIRGRGEYHADGKVYQLARGDGFLIVPNQSTFYRSDLEDPWEYFWVGFHGSEAKNLLEQANLNRESLIFHYDRDDMLRHHLASIHDVTKRKNCLGQQAMEYAMIGYLYLFISCLIKENRSNSGASQKQDYFARALRFIEENFSYDISVEDIASFVGVDRTYLYRIFIEQLSISPSRYLMDYRLNRAARMLAATDLSLKEAAYSVGFRDVAHFSRSFHKKYGMSPLKYRKMRGEKSI